MTVNAIPQGFHSLTPYLVTIDAKSALDFYVNAFGAIKLLELNTPDGSVAHAEMKLGDSIFMVTDEYPDMGFLSPKTLGGAGVSLMIYTEDVDQMFAQAISAGAVEIRPVIDQFYGDRAGTLKDPYGHVWTIATHKEELSEHALNERMQAYFNQAE